MNEQRLAEEVASEKGLSVQFTLEPDDMRAFIAYNRKHSPQHKRLRLLYAVVTIGPGINHALNRYHQPCQLILGFLTYFVIYVGLFWGCLTVVRWFTQRRVPTARNQPGLFCEHTITLFEDALFEETPVNRSEHRWTGIHSISETPTHIFILIAANTAHVIPKRAFADADAERAFFNRAQELYRRAHQD